MLEQLHFIRPLWLLALIPLALLAWRIYRPGGDNPWARIVDARLLPLLMTGTRRRASRSAPWLAAIGWVLASLALAGPTWERKPQPVFESSAARVVVLDLSNSMNADDLKPSRLARARYKIQDVLSLGAEGQTGLVVYAGSAFAVTPLTRDANTIRSQLDALAPDLMPIDGGRADLGLLKAEQLLRHAGMSTGQILLVADGVAPGAQAATEQTAARLKRAGYRVSVISVGSVPTSTDATALQAIARAGGGVDLPVDGGIGALRAWIDASQASKATGAAQSKLSTRAWKEEGPLLVLLLLPLAALAFRRNWLLSLMLLPLLTLHPRDAMAATWNDLWQRPDQQASAALSAGDYANAARLASDADRRGSAEYKRGEYRLALQDFTRATGARADYNRGNALAKLGRYPEAIAAYDQALKADPANADARANKSAVEALLKQQQAKAEQDKAGQGKPGQGGSPSKGDAKQGSSGTGKDQDASGRGGKASSSAGQGKEPEKGGKGKQDEAGAKSTGKGSQDATGKSGDKGARDADGQPGGKGSQEASAQGGAGGRGSASKATDQRGPTQGDSGRDQGNSDASKTDPARDAASANGAARQDNAKATPSASSAPKPGSEFADAAQKLAANKAANQPDTEGLPGPNAASGEAARAGAGNAPHAESSATNTAQPLPTEEQLAAEQWLRRIPDDPGGLLRRKFLYQYRQQSQAAPGDDQ